MLERKQTYEKGISYSKKVMEEMKKKREEEELEEPKPKKIKELNEKQIKYIEDFINKGDKKKNKLEKKIFDKKDIKNMLFSLQLLIDYFQRENFDKYESICDLIKKLPKKINI